MPRSKRVVPLPSGRPLGPPPLTGECSKCGDEAELSMTDSGPLCERCCYAPIVGRYTPDIDDPDPYC